MAPTDKSVGLAASTTMARTVDRPVDGLRLSLVVTERAAITRATRGELAEGRVVDRLRAILPADVLVLQNVKWLLRERGTVRNGEADLVIGHPDRGFLVLEVKSGQISRDGNGTWWAGPSRSPEPVRAGARQPVHALKKLHELPDWPAGLKPIAGHAVALPDVDLDTMRGRLGCSGPMPTPS